MLQKYHVLPKYSVEPAARDGSTVMPQTGSMCLSIVVNEIMPHQKARTDQQDQLYRKYKRCRGNAAELQHALKGAAMSEDYDAAPWSDLNDGSVDRKPAKPRRTLLKIVLGLTGVVTSLVLLGGFGLAIYSVFRPSLPDCTSSQVASMITQLIHSEGFGAEVQSISDFREIEYDRDARRRTGECKIRWPDAEIAIRFAVEWQDRSQGKFIVKTLSDGLPTCDDPRIRSLLRNAVKSVPIWSAVKSVADFSEISYDRAANRRVGRFLIHDEGADVTATFTLELTDSKSGAYSVKFKPSDPPSCANAKVAEMVEQIVKQSLPDAKLALSDFRETHYAKDARRRFGQCTATTSAGKQNIRFSIDLREDGNFLINLIGNENADA